MVEAGVIYDPAAEGGEASSIAAKLRQDRFMGNLLRGTPPQIPHRDSFPGDASRDFEHCIFILHAEGAAADVPYICLKQDDGSFEWVEWGGGVVTGTSTSDLKDNMVANELVTDGGATPLNLDGGKLTCGEAEIDGTFNHDGALFGIRGRTPVADTFHILTGSRTSQLSLIVTSMAQIGHELGFWTNNTTP